MRSPATRLAASNAAIGAKLITLKPVGKKSPSRKIVASQSADEVAAGGPLGHGVKRPEVQPKRGILVKSGRRRTTYLPPFGTFRHRVVRTFRARGPPRLIAMS